MSDLYNFLHLMITHFNREDLRTICFELEIDYENLSGETKVAKARELIFFVARHNQLAELKNILYREKPFINWPDVSDTLLDLDSYEAEEEDDTNSVVIIHPGAIVQAQNISGGDIIIHDDPLTIRHEYNRQKFLQSLLELLTKMQPPVAQKNKKPHPFKFTYRPQSITRPWMMDAADSDISDHSIPLDMSIYDIFHRFNGSILILGEAGSGKTTVLFELTHKLVDLAKRSSSQPIPILLDLTTWTTRRQTIKKLLIRELQKTYAINPQLVKEWIEFQPFHLLLDNLNKVNNRYRNNCVEAINKFTNQYGYLHTVVVCSRIQEYEELPTQLKLSGAILIKPTMTGDV